MFYSSQAEELRAFLRDKLGLADFVDAGEGWLIFNLPQVEIAAHPTDFEGSPPSGTHYISFYCDDIQKTVEDLKTRGVEFIDGIEERSYGSVTHFKAPGGFEVELYQPTY